MMAQASEVKRVFARLLWLLHGLFKKQTIADQFLIFLKKTYFQKPKAHKYITYILTIFQITRPPAPQYSELPADSLKLLVETLDFHRPDKKPGVWPAFHD